MLIPTWRADESVMIGGAVTITVLGMKGKQVRIGINAPKNHKHQWQAAVG